MAKTIVGELKDLFVKFGGDAGDLTGKETTAEMIDALEKVYEDKGDTLPEVTADDNGKVLGVVNGEWDKADAPDELPAVTSDDNGKVLTVANGAWGKADAPSGNNDFVVTYTGTEDEQTQETVYTADKTVTEILAAIEAGKNVKAITSTENGDVLCFNLSRYDNVNSTKIVNFSDILSIGEDVIFVQVRHALHADTETIAFTMYELEKQSQ